MRATVGRTLGALALAIGLFAASAGPAMAVPGQSRGVVTLPGNGSCSVAGAFDGTYYITINTNSCSGNTLGIYLPPATGAGPATLVSTKPVVDSVTGSPVTLSAVDWDSSRNLLWGVHGSTSGRAYLINIGNPTMSVPATATLQFTYNVSGIALVDGLAWDFNDDTLWISPDVDCSVNHFSTTGTSLGSIQPKNAAGTADCLVSGVAIGAANSLYIARNGTGEIRRVSKANGSFVSGFATTNFRVEDLVCAPNLYTDPITGPIEVILAKDAFGASYEAFEVQTGTCPAPPGPPAALDLTPPTDTNTVGEQHCVTATVTDAQGTPTPGITVRFTVTGANPTSGSGTTDANGQATFCYTGTVAGTDTISAFADTDGDGTQDADEPSDTATKTWLAGPPATLVLTPATDTNTVGDQHCVTATVKDAFGNATPGIVVRFSVAGSVTTSGSATTNAAGQATFCYTGPALPGADVITAYADTNGDSVRQLNEPQGTAAKTWVIPTSTAGCKVTYGGRITLANGDKATFGGNAKGDGPSGQEEYQDHGPVADLNVHSINVLSVVCSADGKQASIFGTATINGSGSYDYRIDLKDLGEPGDLDTYRIRLSNGYDSGEQVLEGGNVQIH